MIEEEVRYSWVQHSNQYSPKNANSENVKEKEKKWNEAESEG
jgi:hypothetical protein